MATLSQLTRHPRRRRRPYSRSKALLKCPQKLGYVRKLVIIKPKKPNSAQRKVAKVQLTTKRIIYAMIPGRGHDLAPFSNVLVRGGYVPDLPGVNYKLIRGAKDLKAEKKFRSRRRSKFGHSRKDYYNKMLENDI